MAENLNVERFKNGDLIPQAKSPLEWVKYAEAGQSAWCYYNYEKANSVKHGKIYNWYAVNDSRGLAPAGYNVPSDADWVTLINYLGGFGLAGQNMKSFDGWGNENVNNLFRAYPSGACNNQGNCYGLGSETGWWSATETSEIFAFRIKLGDLNSSVDRIDLLKKFGLSVRCLKSSAREGTSNSSTNNITESSDCSDIVKAYELAVRKQITALRKIRNNAFVSKDEFINLDNDIRKWTNIVTKKCAYDLKYANRVINIMEQLGLGYNSTYPSVKENSVSNTNNNTKSSSNSSSSSSNSGKKSHEFNVIVQWQKTCGNCSFPSPSAQNGIVDYFNERSGSYRVIPVCPICGKKQYKTVSGFTINMIEGNKTFRVVCKDLN